MTDFLRNDREFIQSIYRYEKHNGRKTNEVHENLCRLIGKKDSDQDKEFLPFSEELLTDFKKTICFDVDQQYCLQNNQKLIRSIILYEVLNGKEKEEIYENLCKFVGKDDGYYDVGYWFHRFRSGKYSPDYNRDLDPVSPTFLELPIDVFKKIVGEWSWNEKLSLRKISRNLRDFIDYETYSGYKNMEVFIENNSILIKIDEKKVLHHDIHALVEYLRFQHGVWNYEKLFKSKDFLENAVNHMAIVLKNQNICLDCLSIQSETFNREHECGENSTQIFHEKMLTFFKTLKHKISVKKFALNAKKQEDVLSFLPFLKPGTLEKINLCKNVYTVWEKEDFQQLDLNEVVTLEQWRQAKEVSVNRSILAPIEKFSHLPSFYAQLETISIEELTRLKDELLTSNEFENGELRIQNSSTFLEGYKIFGLDTFPYKYHWKICYCPMPNSKYYLKFKYDGGLIIIEKKPYY